MSMYVRFVTEGAVTRSGVAPGFFQEAYDLVRRPETDPVTEAVQHELQWFEDNLLVPENVQSFCVRAKGVWHKDGVCWFRADASEAISHGHVLAALLEDHGIPVECIRTKNPGTIFYRDDMQVVAKPTYRKAS